MLCSCIHGKRDDETKEAERDAGRGYLDILDMATTCYCAYRDDQCRDGRDSGSTRPSYNVASSGPLFVITGILQAELAFQSVSVFVVLGFRRILCLWSAAEAKPQYEVDADRVESDETF